MRSVRRISFLLVAALCGVANAQVLCNRVVTAGCVNLTIDLSNRGDEEALVSMRVVDSSERLLWSQEAKIAKGAASIFQADVKPGAKLRWSFRPASILDARFDLPPRDLNESSGPQPIVEVIPQIQKYSDSDARAALGYMEAQFGLKGKAFTSEDALRELGSVWVQSGAGKRLAQYHLRNATLTAASKQNTKKRTAIQGSTLSNATANAPLIASFNGTVENSHLYLLQWDVVHYPLTNVSIALDMFRDVPELTIKAIRTMLGSVDAEALCHYSSATVVKSLLYSVTKGKKVASSASVSYSTVFTAGGSYVFDANESDTTTLTDLITLPVETCVPKAAALDALKATGV